MAYNLQIYHMYARYWSTLKFWNYSWDYVVVVLFKSVYSAQGWFQFDQQDTIYVDVSHFSSASVK